MPNRATRCSIRINRRRNFLRRDAHRSDEMRLQRCTEPTYFRSKTREFGGSRVPVRGVNFGHRTLGRETGDDDSCGVPLSPNRSRCSSRRTFFFARALRDLNPPDESLLLGGFFLSFLFSCLFLTPAGSDATPSPLHFCAIN